MIDEAITRWDDNGEAGKTEDAEGLSPRQIVLRNEYKKAVSGLDTVEFSNEDLQTVTHNSSEVLHAQWKKDRSASAESGHWRSAKFADENEKKQWEQSHPDLAANNKIYNESTQQINLLALDIAQLPQKWIEENTGAAKLVAEIVRDNLSSEKTLSFDEIADIIHQNWMIRNSENLLEHVRPTPTVDRLRQRISAYLTSPDLPGSPQDVRIAIVEELRRKAAGLPETAETSYAKKQFKDYADLSEGQKFLDERQIVLVTQEMKAISVKRAISPEQVRSS
jgi:hypothetical protein